MNILVTGGAGFQGTHLVEKLFALGHSVTVLNTDSSRSLYNKKYIDGKAEIIWGSVMDASLAERVLDGKDLVFHLAARINVDESISTPQETLDVNVRGTQNILDAARKRGTRVIYTSSCEAYGRPEKTPIHETTELRPMSPYAASKTAADRLCYAYFHTYQLPVTIVRFFNVFGERQKDGKYGAVIPIFVGKALRGEPISVFGTGDQTRDYVYITDVIDGYSIILDHPELASETINFGSGIGTRIKDIAEYIGKKLNTEVIYSDPRPGEASEMIADSSKAKRLFGWEPKVNIYEGIDRYIDWRIQEEHL